MKDNSPSIGGNNPRAGSDPALPLKTIKFPLRTDWCEYVLTPENAEQTPVPIEGHRYVMGFSRGEYHGVLTIIDASLDLLVGYHTFGPGLSNQIERTIELAHKWSRAFVVVDAGNGGEYLAEAIRSRGVSGMVDRPTSRAAYARDLFALMDALRDGNLAIYPESQLFGALRSIDFIQNNHGQLLPIGLAPDQLVLLYSIAFAWRFANSTRYQFGILPIE